MAARSITAAVRSVFRHVQRRCIPTVVRTCVRRVAVAATGHAPRAIIARGAVVVRGLSTATRPVLCAGSSGAVGDTTVPNNVDERCIGVWEGVLSVNGNDLRMVWRVPATIDAPPAGQGAPAVCMFDFPDAFQYDTPSIPAIRDGGNTLAFEIPGVGEYVGELSGDGNSVAGKWSQGGMDYDLVLERKSMSAPVGEAAAQERHVRPQRPSGTPPYDVKEVVITNPDAAVALSATLTVPSEAAAGPVPAVVLVCGSGPHTRNQNVFGHDVFWVLADHLTRAGVAVVRYDKRGVGTSTGTFKGSTPVDFASDAAAVVKWLHAGAKDVFQASSVGIVGHSEGALVAAVVANALGTDVVNHVALLAGMAVPGNELVLEQGYLVAKAEGLPTELLDLMHPFNKRMFDAAASIKDDDELRAAIVAARADARAAVPEEAHEALGLVFNGSTDAADDAAANSIMAPDTRWLLQYNPVPQLKQLKCPTLAIGGALDLQVPPANLASAKEVLAGNPGGVEVVEFPQCNHLFQTATTGAVSEYQTTAETMRPDVMDTIASWVHRTVAGVRK